MKITQCRNATLIIHYAGKKILVDPAFAGKGTYPPFPSLERRSERNPLYDLPVPVSEMTDVDAVIVTHMHLDHFDREAGEQLPKHLPVFVQNEEDRQAMLSTGFQNVTVLTEHTVFASILLCKTGGQHGYDEEIRRRLGPVCGVVMQNETEETLYLAGDTVWCRDVEKALERYAPSVIIVNAGANSALDRQLIMGKEEITRIHAKAADAKIVATHMEAYNHWTLSRKELKEYAKTRALGLSGNR